MTPMLRALVAALLAITVRIAPGGIPEGADRRGVSAWQQPAADATVRFGTTRQGEAALLELSFAGRASVRLTGSRLAIDEPGRRQIIAQVEGDADGRVILSNVRDAWHGLAMLEDGWYELTGEGPSGTGQAGERLGLRAVRIDHDKVPACGGGIESPEDGPAPRAVGTAERGSITEYTLLACYTSKARRAAGGRDAIIARILSAVTLTNTSYELSELDVRVRLVGTLEQEAREADSTFNSTLSFFTASGNASYPDAEPARELLGADLMTLLIDRHELCGIAWLFTGSEYRGASVCSWACVGSTGTLAHEIGHNMGCNHDRDNASSSTAPYGFGHRFTGDDGALYRTMMAYAPGQRVARFSNPDVDFAGVPTGVPIGTPGEAHNAQVIRDNIEVLSRFRTAEGRDANGNYIDDAMDIASGYSRDENADGVPDEAQTTVLRVGSPKDLAHWPDAVTSVEQAFNTAESDASQVEEVRFASGVLAASEPFTPGRRVPFIQDRVRYLGGFDPATGERDAAGARTVLAGDVLGNDDPGDQSTTSDNTQRIAQGFHLTEGTLLSGLHVRDVRADTDFFQGAGFLLSGAGEVQFEDCVFSSCSAESGGAAVHIERQARVTLERCVVRDTPADGGPAVSLFDRAHIETIGSVFENNRADFNGAAISTFSECTVALQDSLFRDNTSPHGGAISISGRGGEIIGCVFEGNLAEGDGGALFYVGDNGDSIIFRDSRLVRNSAVNGGAAAVTGGAHLIFLNSAISGNTATGGGGAVFLQDHQFTTSAPTVVFHASSVLSNEAGGNGGALLSEDPGSSVKLVSSVLAFNVSDGEGGAVLLPEGATPTIDASTVYGNRARHAGGVSAPGASFAQFTSSIYWNNIDEGTDVRDANLFADGLSGFSIVSHNSVQDDLAGDGSVYPGTANTDQPPAIIRPATPGPDLLWGTADDDAGDWRPAPGSPVADAGTTAWLSRDTYDLDGDTDTNETIPFGVDGLARIRGAGLDIGAAETAPGCGPADLADPFGSLDMLDITAFITMFGALDPGADLSADGTFDLADVVAFVGAFTGGCG